MQQISSAITGALERVAQGFEQTGPQSGETGLVANETEAREWLLAREPEAVDKALSTSLKSSLGVVAEPAVQLRFPTSGGFRREVTGFNVGGVVANLPTALRMVEAACTPLRVEGAEEWIAALQAVTISRKRSETGEELALGLYAAALTRYPADVAKAACTRLAAAPGGWFPPLAEVTKLCDELASSRFALRTKLREMAR